MMILKKISFAVVLSALAFTQSTSAATIVPVPAPVATTVTSPQGPVSGEFQGMVTSVTSGFISINNDVLQLTGDAVITYNGELTSLAVGQIVNYTYATDVDGVKIATTIDAYPTQSTSGTARVYGLDVNNATGGVQLYLGYGGAWATYTGPAVEYFQPYAFIRGIGTNTSYGVQLVNYVGFINPITGRILATSGYMSDIPVNFKPTLPVAVVGQAYNQYTMELGIYGAGDVYMVTAAGLPAGLTVSSNGVISGTPTTPGTYVVSLTAMCGQHCVAPYTAVGAGTVTIVVVSNVIVTPVDTVAPVITMNGTDVTLTSGTSYVDAGATCADNVDTTCTVVTTSTVDTAVAGTYTVTYSAIDVAGNIATRVVRNVTVSAPVASCSGTDQVITNAANPRAAILEIGGGPSNGGIAVQIAQNSTTVVSPLAASTFFAVGNIISFVGTMSASNLCVATSATISAPVVVTPVDAVAPVITMNGTDVTLTSGTSYVDAGATCTDNVDTSCAVTTTSTVNSSTVGTYTVTYSAKDAAGNIAMEVVRSVTVNSAPVVVPDTTYTSTGKKVESKGVLSAYNASLKTVTLTNGIVLRVISTTKSTVNDGANFASIGVKVQFKGIKNTDGSVTLISIEIN